MSHVFTLTPEQMQRLRIAVNEGYELSKPPYTEFVAKADQLNVALYTSGKLVIQGKRAAEFIEMTLEPLVLLEVQVKAPAERTWRIGVDEAGKGDYFGPLVVAGVCAGEDRLDALLELGVRDSKTLSDSVILEMARKIRQTVRFSLVRFFPDRYNELYQQFGNLNKLLAWGHAKAIAVLHAEHPVSLARIDQFAAPWVVESALKKQKVDVHLEQSVRGESDPVIAAASILARAGFLEGLEQCSQQVGLRLPKGAGAPVLTAARELVQLRGEPSLQGCAKLHFKTTQVVLGKPMSPEGPRGDQSP
jgi:ribonuclease HIII